ncbi:lactonase family protein [Bifidobacterium sp.]|uniref:lactonase family protein n=1 Tax=Bifidobacterium sp. TaxID=41200 RepID=UPI0025C3B5EE|nr:beta-propeller fold lactonase family protein [Bifidobacterium sp.]MCI1224480.1 lactonase family protein [Bifidobacterium sp.]
MLYAVLENTGEVASLRIVRNDGGGRGAGCRCNDEHRDNGRVCGGRDGAKDCADNLNRDGHDGDDGDARGRNVRLEQTSRITVQGDGPTHAALAIDDEGHRHLIVACYGDGSIGVHRLDEQGRILPGNQLLEGEGHGPLPAQAGPHAHWILPLPDGRVLTTDLGADRVYVHRWEHGTLRRSAAVRLAPGTGPRDMHLMPTNGGGWRVAVVDEWGCTVTVLAGVFEQDFGQDTVPQPQAGDADAGDHAFADGGVRVVQTISLGGDAIDQAASLAYVPSGRLGDAVHCGETARAEGHVTDGCGIAYVGLRGSDRIVALLWDGERFARLTDPGVNDGRGRGTPCGGSRPRQLVAFGTLLLAADEASNNLAVFDIEDAGEPCLVARFDADSPTVILRV